MAALEALIEALRRLPGVGQKSAQRMAYHLLQHDREGARRMARALDTAVQQVGHCERCDPVHDHRPPRDRLRLMEGGGTFHASPTRKQAITRNKEDA